MKRRDFLKLLGVAGAATMSTSCIETYHWMGTNSRKRYSYLSAKDEQAAKGEAYYASTCMECSGHCGVLVRVREGNAVKLEGNPEHPSNKGALCARGQASLSRLYDPNRIQQPQILTSEGKYKNITWVDAYQMILDALKKSKEEQKNNYYLSGRTTGSLSGLVDTFCSSTGVTRLPEFEPFAHANLRMAYKTVFGLAEIPRYDIENSDLLVSIGADVFETFLSPISHTVQLTNAKKNEHWKWLHVGPHLTAASLKANERYNIKASSEVYLLRWLLSALGKSKALKNEIPADVLEALAISEEDVAKTGIAKEKLEHILAQVKASKKPLFISGGVAVTNETGLEVATLTALLQWGLGAETLDFEHSENYNNVGNRNDFETTIAALKEKKAGVFFVTRCNPTAHVPSFAAEFKNATLKVGFGLVMDETLKACDLVLPLSHFIESLDDIAPEKGLLNLIQPVMESHGTKQEGDILLELAQANGNASLPISYEDYLYDSWAQLNPEEVFVQDRFLEKGFVHTKLSAAKVLHLESASVQEFIKNASFAPEVKAGNTLLITPSVRFFDGRSKDISLLSEIPDSLTSITYGEWVSIAEKTANANNLVDCDEVELTSGDFKVTRVVRVQPVMQEGILVIQEPHLAGNLGSDKRSGEMNTTVTNVSIKKVGHRRIPMLSGSMHQDKRGVNDRGIIPHNYHPQHHPPAGYTHDSHDANKDELEHVHRKTLYPDNHEEYAWSTGTKSPYRWAMAIDLATCTGCTACVAACYIENNISIAGAEDHLMGREMSWLRFEPHLYTDEISKEEDIELLPMLCQQCENAPCEAVCPVFATYHNPDGLNAQIYNRCVGTRYCANNCPYKVRRFNYFDNGYKDRHLPLHSVHNPDVFVRSKGIMEKCTFCVHRIRVAKDKAKDENRLVKDGEVVPACVQTCATSSIAFGNIYDKESNVYKLAHADSVHRIFEETGVEPSVYYLGKKGSKDEPRQHG